MLQRCFVVDIEIDNGERYVEIDLANKKTKLAPLAIKIDKLIIRKK